jgi:prepilin-type N-terminal cleavage/methylation domain-containing protein
MIRLHRAGSVFFQVNQSMRFARPRRRFRAGFTLVELLVVVGLIAVLASILLPALSASRRQAQRVRCAAQLRELVAASQLYLDQYRWYPAPLYMPAAGGVMPASVQPRLLQQLVDVLKLKTDIATATSIDQLPPIMVCPLRRPFEFSTTLDPSLGTGFFATGYMYLAGLEQPPNAGTLVDPRQHAPRRGNRRGVLWADGVVAQRAGGTLVGYAFYHHNNRRVQFEAATRVSRVRDGLDGQHRAWSDGSVEWIPAGQLAADPTTRELTPSYRISLGGGAYQVAYTY